MIKRVVVQCITLRKHLLLRVAAAGFDSLLNALPLDTCSTSRSSDTTNRSTSPSIWWLRRRGP